MNKTTLKTDAASLGEEEQMPHLIRGFVTGLGIGSLPAPGTTASFCTLLLFTLFPWAPSFYTIGWLVALFGISVYAVNVALPRFSDKDPKAIVIDEILGMLLVLLMIPPSWGAWIAGFVLFRLFDIWKPPPVSTAEQLPGGWGVMADDLVAALYTLLILQGGSAIGMGLA